MLYKDHVNLLREKYIGTKVYYGNELHTIVGIDYNCCALIDKRAQFTETTAVDFCDPLLRFAWFCN